MSAADIVVSQGRIAETLNAIRDGVRVHALLYCFALFVVTAAVLESQILGIPLDLQMVMLFSGPVLLVLMIMILIGLAQETVRLARIGHEGSLFVALGVKLRDDYLTPTRISNGFHAVIFMTAYMVGYTFIKRAIPSAVPFSWDETFMRLVLVHLEGGDEGFLRDFDLAELPHLLLAFLLLVQKLALAADVAAVALGVTSLRRQTMSRAPRSCRRSPPGSGSGTCDAGSGPSASRTSPGRAVRRAPGARSSPAHRRARH
jgi:hypothetical protein